MISSLLYLTAGCWLFHSQLKFIGTDMHRLAIFRMWMAIIIIACGSCYGGMQLEAYLTN